MTPAPRRLAFFALIWLATVSLNAHIIAPAPVFPELQTLYGVGNAAVAALISIVLLAAIVVQVPGAYLIDRWDNRSLVLLAIVGLNATSLPPLVSASYQVALLSRFATGLFVPLIFVGFANLVTDAFPTARARILGAYLSSPPAGYALGTFGTAFVPPVFGLPAVYLVYALPLLALLPLIRWAARGIPHHRGTMLGLRSYLAAFRSGPLWLLGLAFAATYALYILFTSWMPTFLRGAAGASLALGGSLGALVPALGILSRPLGGYLAETVWRTDKRRILLLSFAALVPLSLVWLTPAALAWALLILPLAGFFIQLPFPVYYAFSSEILPARLRGSAYTFMNTTSLIGGVLAPYAAGFLLDWSRSFDPVFLLAAGLGALGLVLALVTTAR